MCNEQYAKNTSKGWSIADHSLHSVGQYESPNLFIKNGMEIEI